MDQAQRNKLKDHARKCRDLARNVIPREIAERLKSFARVYEERAGEPSGDERPLVEPAHFPSNERNPGRS